MIKSKNGVEVRGTVNTVDFERVMNQFSSSFTKSVIENLTESFLKVMESQFGIGIQPQLVEVMNPIVVKSESDSFNTISKNSGFGKLKNQLLKSELQNCGYVDYDESKHITVRELGYKSIFDMDKMSIKFWKSYFLKNCVYLRNGIDSSKITSKILFDRGIVELLQLRKSEPKSSDSTLPQ